MGLKQGAPWFYPNQVIHKDKTNNHLKIIREELDWSHLEGIQDILNKWMKKKSNFDINFIFVEGNVLGWRGQNPIIRTQYGHPNIVRDGKLIPKIFKIHFFNHKLLLVRA